MKKEQKRIIWTNDDYDEWLENMVSCMEEGESVEDFDEERYCEDCDIFYHDEKSNLNIPLEGCIVCFGSLGLWHGRVNGAKIVGGNVNKILISHCGDFVTYYCDRYNVRCDDSHHDGTNHYLFRLAKNRDEAESLVNKIAYGGMTEEQFRKRTRSLRPFVAKVYGW